MRLYISNPGLQAIAKAIRDRFPEGGDISDDSIRACVAETVRSMESREIESLVNIALDFSNSDGVPMEIDAPSH